MTKANELLFSLRSMTVYQALLRDGAIAGLIGLIGCGEEGDAADAARYYSELFCALSRSGMSLPDHIYHAVLYDSNAFTRLSAGGQTVPPALEAAVRHDLAALAELAYITPDELKSHIAACFPAVAGAVNQLPAFTTGHERYFADETDWGNELEALRGFCRENGFGVFARYHVFSLDENAALVPVENHDTVTLEDLIGYGQQIEAVRANTQALLAGKGGANILLCGDPGTGKSSTVRAVANSFADLGLRLISVKKPQIRLLPQIFAQLADNPLKFVVFLDDLSFSDMDDCFSALKPIIDGGEQIPLSNVAVYAATDCRDLVREPFSSRLGDEALLSDRLDEVMSLSDRFAITLPYPKLDRAEYSAMVSEMARRGGLADNEELCARALAYSEKKGGYSPRAARQFVLQMIRAL